MCGIERCFQARGSGSSSVSSCLIVLPFSRALLVGDSLFMHLGWLMCMCALARRERGGKGGGGDGGWEGTREALQAFRQYASDARVKSSAPFLVTLTFTHSNMYPTGIFTMKNLSVYRIESVLSCWNMLRIYTLWRYFRDYKLALLPKRHTISSFSGARFNSVTALFSAL